MTVLDKVLAFLTFAYFARYFEPGVFGTAYVIIGLSVLGRSLPESVGNAIRKRVSEVPDSYDAYFTLGFIALIIYTIVGSVILKGVLSTFTLRYESLAFAGVFHMAARSYLALIQQVARGTGNIGNASVAEFFDGVGTILMKFALILGLGLGAEGLIYAPAASALVTGTVFYWSAFVQHVSLPTRTQVTDSLNFFRWDAIGRIMYKLLSRSETALVGMFIGPASASYIKSARTAVEPGLLPVKGIEQSVFVEISGRSSDGLSYASTAQKGLRYAGIFAIPLLFGAVIFSDKIMVTLFGSDYSGTGFVLIATSVAILGQSYRQILVGVIQGVDKPEIVTYTHVGLSLVIFPIYIIILTYDSFVWFIAAFASSYIFEVIILASLARYIVVKEPIIDWSALTKQAISGGSMLGVLFILESAFPITGMVPLGITILFGAGVYFMVLTAVSLQFRTHIREVLHRVNKANIGM